jgi:hypothetical protein
MQQALVDVAIELLIEYAWAATTSVAQRAKAKQSKQADLVHRLSNPSTSPLQALGASQRHLRRELDASP